MKEGSGRYAMMKRILKRLLLLFSAVLAFLLFFNFIGGALCNDIRASRLEKGYASLPLLPDTKRIEVSSFVGNTGGTGNHTEIWVGMLIQSSLSAKELAQYFPDDDVSAAPLEEGWARFDALVGESPGEGFYVVSNYYDAFTQADLRGH